MPQETITPERHRGLTTAGAVFSLPLLAGIKKSVRSQGAKQNERNRRNGADD